jgi:hypothetical protein
MSNLRVRVTERDQKTGRYVKHNVMLFKELKDEVMKRNRSYFWLPVWGYYRRKTLHLIIETLRRMT